VGASTPSTDLQKSPLEWVRVRKENITRVVAIFREILSGFGGLESGILFAPFIGYAFVYPARRPATSPGEAGLAARLLPAGGALPLPGTWSTLFF
jgi:hypothetical protein